MATGTIWIYVNIKNIPLGIRPVKGQGAAVPEHWQLSPAVAQGSTWHWTSHDSDVPKTTPSPAAEDAAAACKHCSVFYRKKHMTQLQGINYSRFSERRSLLYCVPGDKRNVLNLFMLQTFDLPEGRICLHGKEQSRRAAVPEELHTQLWFVSSSTISWLWQFQGTAPEALPFISATGFFVGLFLFTDLFQHRFPVLEGPKNLLDLVSVGIASQNSGVCQGTSLMWDSILNTSSRIPHAEPHPSKSHCSSQISVPMLRGVTAPAPPKAHPLLHLWGHLDMSTNPGSIKDHSMGTYILVVFM